MENSKLRPVVHPTPFHQSTKKLKHDLMTRLHVRSLGGFSRAMTQTTQRHARVKPFRFENSKLIFNRVEIPPRRLSHRAWKVAESCSKAVTRFKSRLDSIQTVTTGGEMSALASAGKCLYGKLGTVHSPTQSQHANSPLRCWVGFKRFACTENVYACVYIM